jgi:hypothetical protein
MNYFTYRSEFVMVASLVDICEETVVNKQFSDEGIPMIQASSSIKHPPSNMKDTNQGPITRRRAKKLQEQLNSFLTDYNFNTSKNVILPKIFTLMLLRYILPPF